MNKTTVQNLIVAQLRSALELQTRAALLSRDEAISEESRPENQYDMHSQEAAYLAEGQARLAAEIADNLKLYETMAVAPFAPGATVSVGALVEIAGGRTTAWYYVGPRGGGLEVEVDGQTVLVLTPQSPLGRELLGKPAGATVRLPGRAGGSPHLIVTVC